MTNDQIWNIRFNSSLTYKEDTISVQFDPKGIAASRFYGESVMTNDQIWKIWFNSIATYEGDVIFLQFDWQKKELLDLGLIRIDSEGNMVSCVSRKNLEDFLSMRDL